MRHFPKSLFKCFGTIFPSVVSASLDDIRHRGICSQQTANNAQASDCNTRDSLFFMMEKTYMSGGEKENIHNKSKEKILIPEKLPINQFLQIKKTKKIHI